MFGWLISLFAPSKRLNEFRQCEQELFYYWNGRARVAGDPMTLTLRLATDEACDIDREMKMSQVEGQEGCKASLKLVEAVQRAFDLPSVQQGGLTAPNCLQLLRQFIEYEASLKKSFGPSPTNAPCTPATPTDPSAGQKTTDSSSTKTESSPEAPCPSSSASTQLSAV